MNNSTSLLPAFRITWRLPIVALPMVLLCQLVGCSGVDETETVAALRKLSVIASQNADGSVNSLNNLPTDPAQLTEALALITQLQNPKSITILDASVVTGDHIKTLASLKQLVHLELHDAPIGDADIAPLFGHSKLESLYLINSNITAAAMPGLAKIPKLGLLSVSGTKVDGGYEHLQKLNKFEYLVIGGLQIDEEDAKNISSNTTITHVTMDATEIGEAALAILKSNKKCLVDGSTK